MMDKAMEAFKIILCDFNLYKTQQMSAINEFINQLNNKL